MEATDGLEETHVPPAGVEFNVTVRPEQTVNRPEDDVIAVGLGFIVTGIEDDVALHPLAVTTTA